MALGEKRRRLAGVHTCKAADHVAGRSTKVTPGFPGLSAHLQNLLH